MMTDPNIKKLFKASKAASAKQIQHVMLTVSPNGKVHVSGADNLYVTSLKGQQALGWPPQMLLW